MYSSISSHVNMAQNYYNDIQAQYQAIQARNGANTAPVNTVAGAVEYHRQNQNFETDAKIKTYFSGAMDDFVTLDRSVEIGMVFTQEMWLKPDVSGAHRAIIGNDKGPGPLRGFAVFLFNQHIFLQVSNKARKEIHVRDCIQAQLELKKWNHLAFTFADGICKIYINGVEKEKISFPPNDIFFEPTQHIGKIHTHCYQGQIDDVRIWDIARTADQIKDNMFKSMPTTEGNLKFSHCSKKVAALTDHDLQTSSPSALAAKATAIHNLVMRMNDVPMAIDQRNNMEQLKSYVSQLSRIHQVFQATKQKLSLEKQVADLQAQLQAEKQKVTHHEQTIAALTQDKSTLQAQVQGNQQTASGSQIERAMLITKNENLDNINTLLKQQIESLQLDKTRLHDEKMQLQQEKTQVQNMLLNNIQMMHALNFNQSHPSLNN